MGDKGGKKDKAKQEQQLARKQQEKQGKKQDKAPPRAVRAVSTPQPPA